MIDCPALHAKGENYPFGEKVPSKIRMLCTVTADPVPGAEFSHIKGRVAPVALIDQELSCWTNSYGAVAAVLADGEKLGVRPGEFEVIAWHLEQ